MNRAHRLYAICLVSVLGGALVAACQQPSRQPQGTWSGAMPDLNAVEECQKADLSRYWGSTFRFHRDGCWADVSFDEYGRVTAFGRDDAEICRKVLATCVGWKTLTNDGAKLRALSSANRPPA